MKQYRQSYPEQGVVIIINDYQPGAEHSEAVRQALSSRRTGTYTFLVVDQQLSLVSYLPGTPDDLPAAGAPPESLLFPPEYFKKPQGPFDQYDPDNDELPPPGPKFNPN